MKRSYLFIGLIGLSLASCLKKEEVPTVAEASKVRSGDALATTELAPGVVPSDIGLYDIVLHPEKHTWKDLDAFYKNVVLTKKEESYFHNLQKMTIWHMVEQFGMLEKADDRTVEYYLMEQINMQTGLVDGEVFAKCLERIKSFWLNDAIKMHGMQQYEKSKAYAQANFKPEFWEKHAAEYEKIREVAKSVPNRWGQY